MNSRVSTFSPILSLLAMASFVVMILGFGIFYQISGVHNPFSQIDPLFFLVIVAFLYFCIFGISKGNSINKSLDGISEIMIDGGVAQMIMIFLLSGAFGNITNQIGSISSLTGFFLNFIPQDFMLLGVFLISSAVSTALGTSLGTIAIMAPVAQSFAQMGVFSPIFGASAVISGAYFGDNLSLISDTTIASIQTQKADLIGKFKENFKIALPCFVICCIIFITQGIVINDIHIPQNIDYHLILIIPYILVIAMGIARFNVIFVLLTGIILSFLIGIFISGNTLPGLSKFTIDGFKSVSDLNTFIIFIAFLNGITIHSGGMDLVKNFVQKIVSKSSKTSIIKPIFLTLVIIAITNAITANNTIAIIISGSLIYSIFDLFNFNAKKEYIAAVVDNFSCGIHGLLPHAPQVLLASSIAGVSIFDVILKSYYSMLLLVFTLFSAFIVNHKYFKKA